LSDTPITGIIKYVRPLAADEDLAKTISIMRANQVHALPVTQNGRIIGLVHEADILSHTSDGQGSNTPISSIITSEPACANIYMSVKQALDILKNNKLDVLPVIDEFGSYRGLVTRSDLLAAEMDIMTPAMVGGLATPIGVHLTTGAASAGAGFSGLFLTGLSLLLIFEAGRAAILLFAMLSDWLLSTNLVVQLQSTPTGSLSTRAVLGPDFLHYLSLVVTLLLLRLSPLSGYHGAEHQVVHTIESGERLIPEIVSRMPRPHPRCGTNLMIALATFAAITSMFGTSLGVFLAVAVVILGWRKIGYYAQQYITTKKPSPRQLQSGIKAGEELLAKFRREPNKQPDGLSRIWHMGMIQVLTGYTVGILIDLLFSKIVGLPPIFGL